MNAVTWAISDTQFAHTFTNRLHISRIAKCQAFNASDNFRYRLLIGEGRKPSIEFTCFVYFDLCIL